jgi:hypothetical protein
MHLCKKRLMELVCLGRLTVVPMPGLDPVRAPPSANIPVTVDHDTDAGPASEPDYILRIQTDKRFWLNCCPLSSKCFALQILFPVVFLLAWDLGVVIWYPLAECKGPDSVHALTCG